MVGSAGTSADERRPRLSIVVLSYARPHLLVEALAAIAEQTFVDREVLVVDNRSARSDEVAAVVARHPDFRLISNESNLGYTGAMNLGVRMARGELVHLTEDDVVLERRCLERLVDHLDQHPEVAVVSGLVVQKGTDAINCAGGRISLRKRVALEVFGEGRPASGWTTEPYSVDYVTGAMLCARRELLLRLGPFREEFFLYVEDVELCLRVRRAGLRMDVVPAARADHFPPPSTARARTWLETHKRKNAFATFAMHASGWRLGMLLVREGLVDPVARALLTRDARHALAGARALVWFLPRAPYYLLEGRRVRSP